MVFSESACCSYIFIGRQSFARVGLFEKIGSTEIQFFICEEIPEFVEVHEAGKKCVGRRFGAGRMLNDGHLMPHFRAVPRSGAHSRVVVKPTELRLLHLARRMGSLHPVPTKKSVHIEIVAFTESRPVAFPSHVDSTLLSARLFPSPRRSASRDSCSPTSALGFAAFEPASHAPPRLG